MTVGGLRIDHFEGSEFTSSHTHAGPALRFTNHSLSIICPRVFAISARFDKCGDGQLVTNGLVTEDFVHVQGAYVYGLKKTKLYGTQEN